jgi:hypothetical protein
MGNIADWIAGRRRTRVFVLRHDLSQSLNRSDVEEILARCEAALGQPGAVDLRSLEFWRAERAVERHPDWNVAYADRIGAIDRQAFERGVRNRLSFEQGIGALVLGTILGVRLVEAGARVSWYWRAPLLLGGTMLLLVSTHDLAHLLVGRLFGIRFVALYSAGVGRPQPGLKIDYASYLKASPLARALMHASGAIVTKLVPFVVLAVARRQGVARWVSALLAAIGLTQIATDVLFSTRFSDWKRVKRQLRLAHPLLPVRGGSRPFAALEEG